MSKFTKGEWKVDMSSSVSYECLHDFIYPEDLQVRQIDEDVHIALVNHAYPEWQANARLIAAAPELYELVREELIPTSDYGGILSFAREAKVRKLLAYIDGEEAEA